MRSGRGEKGEVKRGSREVRRWGGGRRRGKEERRGGGEEGRW